VELKNGAHPCWPPQLRGLQKLVISNSERPVLPCGTSQILRSEVLFTQLTNF
jgi:hypothetical protein